MKTKSNLFKFFTVALLALWGAVSCVDDISDVLAPQLEIAEEQQQVLFPGDGGVQAIDIAANCEWSVTESSIPTWVSITPTSGNGAGQIVISVPEATSERSATISFELIHPDYGRWGKAETMLYIHQYPGDVDPDFEEQLIFYNDFDKEPATQTFGSGTSWPYLDQSDCWQNQMGIGAGDVTYAYSGLSARNNSNSDSNYSDYAGSGTNNLFFGANGALTIEKIDVSASNKLKLTFGSEKYLQSGDSTFNPAEFQVTLSNDGENWSDPIAYSFPSSFKSGRWDLATANFEIPEGTKTLYIKFAATVASAYRLDDVKLTTGMGGPKIEFSGNGGGGETPDPTPGDGTAIYANNFDKAAATQTFGSGTSWPYLDQSDCWENPTGTGAGNVTHAFSGISARNNSNSNGSYSDYAGSGVNNLFFGASAYFTVEKIDVSSTNKLQLTFGAEKYLQSGDSTFSPAEFKVTLSNDGENWSDPIAYSFPSGNKSGRWDLATANFTIPEGTKTLYIKFAASVASAYRLDDVTLTAGNGGQQIEFANGGGGETPDPTPGGDETDEDLKDAAKPGAVVSFKGADYTSVWGATTPDGEGHGLDGERLVLNGVAITFDTGNAGTPSRWWKADQTFRIYKNSTFTVKAGLPIAKIEVTFKTANNADIGSASTGTGSLNGTTYTWTPSNESTEVVTFTAGTSANSYITAIVVTLAGEGSGNQGGETPDPTPGGDGSAIYANNFDKAAATNTFGSGSSWPYLDQSDCWENQTGTGAGSVVYASSGMSARNNSNSNGNYSDYAGSGTNNLFFGASAYFTIGKIDVSSTNKLKLTFGAEKYLQSGDSTFNPAEFQVTLSRDGENWSSPISYTFPSGYKSGRWDLATADFTLPTGTTTLYIKFAASVASAYRLDDVTLTAGNGGQQVEFTDGGSGGGTVDPTPDPDPTPGPGTDPTPSGGSSVLIDDFSSVNGGNSYAEFTQTAADGSVWTGIAINNGGYLQLGWNTDTSKAASQSYIKTPASNSTIKSITIYHDDEGKTINGRTLVALPVDFTYTGQSVNDVKAAAYAVSAATVANGTAPLTLDLTGQNVQQCIIRSVSGATYIKSIEVKYE